MSSREDRFPLVRRDISDEPSYHGASDRAKWNGKGREIASVGAVTSACGEPAESAADRSAKQQAADYAVARGSGTHDLEVFDLGTTIQKAIAV